MAHGCLVFIYESIITEVVSLGWESVGGNLLVEGEGRLHWLLSGLFLLFHQTKKVQMHLDPRRSIWLWMGSVCWNDIGYHILALLWNTFCSYAAAAVARAVDGSVDLANR